MLIMKMTSTTLIININEYLNNHIDYIYNYNKSNIIIINKDLHK